MEQTHEMMRKKKKEDKRKIIRISYPEYLYKATQLKTTSTKHDVLKIIFFISYKGKEESETG